MAVLALLATLCCSPVVAATPPGTIIRNWAVLTCDAGTVTSKPTQFVVTSFVVNFSASRVSGWAPLAVVFTDLSNGSPTSWNWDFGDGGSSTERNPRHIYVSPGTYTVSLTAADGGTQATATKNAYITVLVPSLAADFAEHPSGGPAPLMVSFFDCSAGNPTTWLWTFGDAKTSSDQNPTHTYIGPGFYTVGLTVGSAAGSDTKAKADCVVAGFPDVPTDFWAYSEIMACLRATMLLGYPDGSFQPARQITRDQTAVYLARALAGADSNVPEGPDQASFRDVPTSYWAYRYIEYVKSRNVILGYQDGEFRPTTLVNRAQMAVFLARSLVDPAGEEGLKSYTPPTTPTFPDVTPRNRWSWCYKHVEYVVSKGVTSGYPDGCYHPGNICTRDQLAVYMARAFGL